MRADLAAVSWIAPLREPQPELPFNIEIEQATLAAMMVSPAAFRAVTGRLLPQHFHFPSNGRLFQAMIDLAAVGADLNPVTLAASFERDPDFPDQAAARSYLSALLHAITMPRNIVYYVDRLIDLAARREAILAAKEMIEQLQQPDPAAPAARVIADFVTDITATGTASRASVNVDGDALAELLDIHTWSALPIPPEPEFLGSIVVPSSRTFFVGRTGIGKTLVAHAMAAGMATGEGFLQWRCERPARVLVIDGEMSAALLKARSQDAVRRAGGVIDPGQLVIYSVDRGEEFARLIPGLGFLAPINADLGHQFIYRLADALRPEVVIFDNVMSLVAGDQKDEVTWSGVLPLTQELTKRKIAQVFLDHTGHNSDRQYGSSTKAWRFDTVGLIAPLPDEQKRDERETAFTLSFDFPGKARRRTGDNWRDYRACTLRIVDDEWTFEVGDKKKALSPKARDWVRALDNALAKPGARRGQTTKAEIYGEGVRVGLAEAVHETDDYRVRDQKRKPFNNALRELREAGLIGIDHDVVTDVRNRG